MFVENSITHIIICMNPLIMPIIFIAIHIFMCDKGSVIVCILIIGLARCLRNFEANEIYHGQSFAK